ncbi:hypothetical protein E2562_019188 [Oryza meyeriana var. granulata]|uniref:Cystatin domain-containing protein n=1 Tax=Oryza meyeriana var. granulata TaxID=110450 RepID=A0A6G1FA23_9ORYZ|nr:hypothetical protein E2562_019188 [Oryza meyeriana var. granulata]
MRSYLALVIALLILLVAVAGAGTQGTAAPAGSPPAPAATGAWVPIGDVRDNFYRQVANFALVVRMLVFKTEELTLVEVVAGSKCASKYWDDEDWNFFHLNIYANGQAHNIEQ